MKEDIKCDIFELGDIVCRFVNLYETSSTIGVVIEMSGFEENCNVIYYKILRSDCKIVDIFRLRRNFTINKLSGMWYKLS